MTKKISPYVFDLAIAAIVLVAGLVYYGDFYVRNEKEFKFYQKYFYSAVNIYCRQDPGVREYNSPLKQEVDERIDLPNISCAEIERSPKVGSSYLNGWHDTHPILSTLIGINWRLGDFTWQGLWPTVGGVAALAVLAYYIILRCFGLPWYAALLIFPATVHFRLLEKNLYFMRDFSKVPFILLSFALLGILFRPGLSYRLRLAALAAATCMLSVGIGFRQDAVVLLPAILAGAAFTSSITSKDGILRFAGDMLVVLFSFYLAGALVDLMRTGQVAQLQGYPHFIVQGFADHFWASSRAETPGISYLALYSDMLAWALVDANSLEKVPYFAALDPRYTASGLDLVVKYSALSAADMVIKVFQGLSAISHDYWFLGSLGAWLVMFLTLIAAGKWRLSFFLMFTILSLAAAGSLQFSPRHSLHLIVLDRVFLVIAFAALLGAVWKSVIAHFDWKVWPAALSGTAGLAAVVAIAIGAFFVQYNSLKRLKGDLDALPWFSSREAYNARYPNRAEAILRFTLDRDKCSSDRVEVILDIEGQKISRAVDLPSGGPRSIYFAVLDPAIEKLSVDVTPRECVTERAWGPLGDGSIPPLQFFDPDEALKKHTIMRHLGNLISSFL